MKLLPVLVALSGALALAHSAAAAAQEGPAGGLRRVQPGDAEESEESRELGLLLAKDFRRDEWLARLAETDLDRRERSFDLLLKRARLDPLARAFIEELARDRAAGELAWTARLALRQLGRVAFPLRLVVPGMPGSDPLHPARAAQALEDLLARGAFPATARGEASAPARGGARWVHVEQGDGGARVRIRERVGGEELTREFEGRSLDEILRENPEVERALGGLDLAGDGGLDLRFALGGAPSARPSEGATPILPRGRSRPIVDDKLGVIVQPVAEARAGELGPGEQGLLVTRVYPETFAQLLGVGAGSLLLELDGIALATAEDIERAMHARAADAPLRLVWLDALGQRMERVWRPPAAR